MDQQFIQEQNDLREDYKVRKKITPFVEVWRSRPTKGLLFLVFFAIVAPVLIYYFVFDKGAYAEDSTDTCSVAKTYRILCGKSQNVTLNYCNSIQCCFDNSTKTCFHYLPSKYYYYGSQPENAYQKSLDKTPFGKVQTETVALSIQEIDANNIRIFLHDPKVNVSKVTGLPDTNYFYTINNQSLHVDVFRNASAELILTTSKGPTIISENYWEWSFQLTDQYLFGLGQTLIELDENSTLTKVVYGNGDDHNTLPIFLAYNNGSYHGLIVRNSGPLEITVLPSKLVSLKSLAGGQIMLELSVGPTIKEVIQQQNREKAAFNVDLPMLGVHICREGSLMSLRDIIDDYANEKSLANETLYESDCFHENLLLAVRDQNADIINTLLGNITQSIIVPGSRFALAIPPQVGATTSLYNNTAHLNIFFKHNNSDYQGKHLDTDVVYPYFNHINIGQFIQTFIEDARSYFEPVWPTDFILPKNWPVDDSFEMTEISDFQYLSQALLDAMSSTLPWDVTSNNQSQFLDHNDYGTFQLTQMQSLSTENPLIMTASHTFDSNQPIILQNVDISWTNFQKAITTILSNSIFGFSLTSVPVCGSTNNFNISHEAICMRWYLMASTSPIFRISSDSPRRDPVSFGLLTSQHAADAAIRAIEFRYSLQYYFYDVLSSGEPLMRPMFYDFPDDNTTFALVEQYMVGPGLLVAHPTLPDQTQITVYLPKAVSTWFEFWGGGAIIYEPTKDGWISLPIVESDWVGFIREGSVVSLVEKSTENATIKNVKLKVALQCNATCNATGTIKISTTTSFTFISSDQELTVQRQGADDNFVLTEIQIFKAVGDPVFLKPEGGIKINGITTCLYNNNHLICQK